MKKRDLVGVGLNLPEDLEAFLSELADQEMLPKATLAKRFFMDGLHLYLAQRDRALWKKCKADFDE